MAVRPALGAGCAGGATGPTKLDLSADKSGFVSQISAAELIGGPWAGPPDPHQVPWNRIPRRRQGSLPRQYLIYIYIYIYTS